MLIAVLAIGLVACVGERGPTPKEPDHVTTPDTVGVLVSYEFGDCRPALFHLDTGETIDLPTGDCEGERIRQMLGEPRSLGGDAGTRLDEGPLMMFGSDEQGPWYAVAHDDFRRGTCYVVHTGAYLEGEALHFPSGLLLPLAEGFKVEPESVADALGEDLYPLRTMDDICLDGTGAVALVRLRTSY